MFTDHHVFVFLLSVLLFHFSNAAMLPLLSQQLFIGNAERGFEFAALAVITAQVSMVCAAMAAGVLVPLLGTKPMFLTALCAIPLRGFIIVMLLGQEPNNVLLLGTQVLDGLAGGIFGVLVVLIAENLARWVPYYHYGYLTTNSNYHILLPPLTIISYYHL
jgi:MFS family permease